MIEKAKRGKLLQSFKLSNVSGEKLIWLNILKIKGSKVNRREHNGNNGINDTQIMELKYLSLCKGNYKEILNYCFANCIAHIQHSKVYSATL